MAGDELPDGALHSNTVSKFESKLKKDRWTKRRRGPVQRVV